MKRPRLQVPPIRTAKDLSLGSSGVWEAVDRSEVGLDVDEWCANDAVDLAHVKRSCLDADQLHGCKCDGVGPHRRAQGKCPAGAVQVCGHLLYEIAPCLVHPIEQQDVAEEPQIGKSRRIARVQLDPADGLGLCRALWTVAA